MPTSEEPIIVRIIRETGRSSAGTEATPGASGGSLASGAAKLTGIFNIMQALASMAGTAINGIMKPLVTLVTGVLKLLAQFLRPAIDILVISLMPLFTLLKPLVKVFNDIMRPFREIAMRMIKSNPLLAPAASGVILQGLSVALLNVVGEFIKTSIGMWMGLLKQIILYPLADLLPWFDREGVDVAVNGIQDMVASGIDTVLKGINQTSLTVAKNIASSLGVMVDDIDFTSSMKKAQSKLQASVNDLFDDLKFKEKSKTSVSLSSNDRYNILSNQMGIQNEMKKYGVEPRTDTAASALQKLRAGMGI